MADAQQAGAQLTGAQPTDAQQAGAQQAGAQTTDVQQAGAQQADAQPSTSVLPVPQTPVSMSVPPAATRAAVQAATRQNEIRSVQYDPTLDAGARVARIGAIVAARAPEAPAADEGIDDRAPAYVPGGTQLGCEHRKTNCKLRAPCCNRYYCCRNCHDAMRGHAMDCHSLDVRMLCMLCGAEQAPARDCVACGAAMAHYYCALCALWDDTPGREAFHCAECGTCRRGARADHHHCVPCGTCIPAAVRDTHVTHVVNNTRAACPICQYNMHGSIEPVCFLPCGHAIHVACHKQHSKTSTNCSICRQPTTSDMSDDAFIAAWVAQQPTPPAWRGVRAAVTCRTCTESSEVPYHILGNRCGKCASFDTQITGMLSS